jgi:hypothetical protein
MESMVAEVFKHLEERQAIFKETQECIEASLEKTQEQIKSSFDKAIESFKIASPQTNKCARSRTEI